MKTPVLFYLLVTVLMFYLPGLAQEKAGSDLFGMLAQARQLTGAGKTAEASAVYTAIMKNYPDNQAAVQNWLILNMKKTPTGEKDAILQLDSLFRIYPRNTGILFFKSFLEVEHNLFNEALTDIEKIVALQPDSAGSWILKGQVLGGIKKFGEAAEAFGRAADLNPAKSEVWGMKGAALAETGKYAEALEAVNRAIGLDPNNAMHYYNRACIYSLQKERESALSDLRRTFELQPSFRENARNDENFKSLFEDQEFKKLIK